MGNTPSPVLLPPPLPTRSPKAGDRRGRYTILRPLASGGMGNLYLAHARGIEGFERLVVLKRLKPDVAGDPENVKLFLGEVQVLASMQHPNVVHIYDVGMAKDGSYFYSMEFLVGQDLRRLMLRGIRQYETVPLPQALFIAGSVLSGLHHVHQRLGATGEALQIVHRDVSPANIFITYDGGVKLIDFGIAKTSQRSPDTGPGVLRGKVRYLSPEQCRMEPVDARSDVFSLGVVLWEMTTGRGLHQGEGNYQTMVDIAEKDARRPSQVVPGYPEDLEAVVMKALARRVQDRWQSAKEMQLALEALAVKRHWPWSSSGLCELMEARFAEELKALRSSRDSGQDLSDYVLRQLADVQATPSAVSARFLPGPRSRSEPPAASPGSSVAPPPGPEAPPSSPPTRVRHRRWPIASFFGMVGLALGVSAGYQLGRRSEPLPAPREVVEARSAMAEATPPTSPAVEGEAMELNPLPVLSPDRAPGSRPPASGPVAMVSTGGDRSAIEQTARGPRPPARRPAPPPTARLTSGWTDDSPFPPP